MDSVPKSRLIRQRIRSLLLEIGARPGSVESETLLIRDGVYCGHHFRFGQYEAVWFVEEEQIKLYGPSGTLVRSLRTSEIEPMLSQQAA